ncbi:hypothetical protein ACTXT7_013811 [Hymenolepis weldensis]
MANILDLSANLACVHYDCSDGGGGSFKTRGSTRHEQQKIPSHLTESSCYTIRMTSMPRHRPSAGDITATTSSAPKTFAYIIPSTSASANVANGVAESEGDYYLIPRLPGPSTEQSAAGQPIDRCVNQCVGCSGTLGRAQSGAELITLPISNDALVRTEIWANDPKSDAYVTLRPYCQLNAFLQNVHFVDPGVSIEGESNNLTDSPSANCPFFQHRQHSSATDSITPPTTPSISVIDPVTGSRIFVPPFAGNTGGLIIPASNNPSSSSAGIIAVSPEPSAKVDAKEGTPESTSKSTPSVNQGSSEKEWNYQGDLRIVEKAGKKAPVLERLVSIMKCYPHAQICLTSRVNWVVNHAVLRTGESHGASLVVPRQQQHVSLQVAGSRRTPLLPA